MEALLAAIEQARAALDQIEMEAAKRSKDMPEEPGPDDESMPPGMPMKGPPGGMPDKE